jgi:hypothetical protein
MDDGTERREAPAADNWKRSFLDKLHGALSQCAKQFDETLDGVVVPGFDELAEFLHDNGFDISRPLNELHRRSFKWGLAENAYLLMIFSFSGVGEFELRTEMFVPGAEPTLEKRVGRLADTDGAWARAQLQSALDRFIDLLAERATPEPSHALAAV